MSEPRVVREVQWCRSCVTVLEHNDECYCKACYEEHMRYASAYAYTMIALLCVVVAALAWRLI